MVKFKIIGPIILFLLVLGMIIVLIKGVSEDVDDFRILNISDEGIVLRSVSWQRKMINELKIEGQVKVWVPKGMSWYRSDKIRKLLISKNKQDLANDMAFYNFGFIPDVVIFGKDSSWIYNREVMIRWGLLSYVRYLASSSRLMIKQEVVSGDLLLDQEVLNETIPRDLADSRLLKDDVRLTVYNLGQSSGLAGFISRILEWSGFTVVGVENSGEVIEMCQINYGTTAADTYTLEVIRKEFGECKFALNKELGESEVELYFGDRYSQMLNYQSYNPVNSGN